ncbi:MAG: hypothetical protein AB7N80_12795 [Bdellovibrionales bacterium]
MKMQWTLALALLAVGCSKMEGRKNPVTNEMIAGKMAGHDLVMTCISKEASKVGQEGVVASVFKSKNGESIIFETSVRSVGAGQKGFVVGGRTLTLNEVQVTSEGEVDTYSNATPDGTSVVIATYNKAQKQVTVSDQVISCDNQ